MSHFNVEFLERILKWRGLTATELSRAIGVARGYISKLTNSVDPEPGFGVVVRIANALNVPLEYFAEGLLNEASRAIKWRPIALSDSKTLLALLNKLATGKCLIAIGNKSENYMLPDEIALRMVEQDYRLLSFSEEEVKKHLEYFVEACKLRRKTREEGKYLLYLIRPATDLPSVLRGDNSVLKDMMRTMEQDQIKTVLALVPRDNWPHFYKSVQDALPFGGFRGINICDDTLAAFWWGTEVFFTYDRAEIRSLIDAVWKALKLTLPYGSNFPNWNEKLEYPFRKAHSEALRYLRKIASGRDS